MTYPRAETMRDKETETEKEPPVRPKAKEKRRGLEIKLERGRPMQQSCCRPEDSVGPEDTHGHCVTLIGSLDLPSLLSIRGWMMMTLIL